MVGCYSLVGASCWLGLLWQGSCYDWMKNVSIKYYPEEVGTCCPTPRPEKEEGGAMTQKPGRRLFRARNFANHLFKWISIQALYRSWLLAIAPPDQLMLTLLLLKNVSGQYVFDLWAPLTSFSHSASCWVPTRDSKKSLSLALISKCLDFTLFWWEFSPGYWPVAIWTSWGEFKVNL